MTSIIMKLYCFQYKTPILEIQRYSSQWIANSCKRLLLIWLEFCVINIRRFLNKILWSERSQLASPLLILSISECFSVQHCCDNIDDLENDQNNWKSSQQLQPFRKDCFQTLRVAITKRSLIVFRSLVVHLLQIRVQRSLKSKTCDCRDKLEESNDSNKDSELARQSRTIDNAIEKKVMTLRIHSRELLGFLQLLPKIQGKRKEE